MASWKARITVLISGSGTNLQALIDAVEGGKTQGSIVRVISSSKNAYGLERAKKHSIASALLNIVAGKYREKAEGNEAQAREAYDKDLAALVLKDKPDVIVCAGWMRILSPSFLKPIEDAGIAIINLHPALPGAYDGSAKAIDDAHADFMSGKITETGIMIHHVIQAVDQGEPIVVRKIPLTHPEYDDLEALQTKIHEVEHVAIVDGTNIVIEGVRQKRQAE